MAQTTKRYFHKVVSSKFSVRKREQPFIIHAEHFPETFQFKFSCILLKCLTINIIRQHGNDVYLLYTITDVIDVSVWLCFVKCYYKSNCNKDPQERVAEKTFLILGATYFEFITTCVRSKVETHLSFLLTLFCNSPSDSMYNFACLTYIIKHTVKP